MNFLLKFLMVGSWMVVGVILLLFVCIVDQNKMIEKRNRLVPNSMKQGKSYLYLWQVIAFGIATAYLITYYIR